VRVDVLPDPCSPHRRIRARSLGLNYRETRRGRIWWLIGGRLLRGEASKEVIWRHETEATGRRTKIYGGFNRQPMCVAQYSPLGGTPFARNRRQRSAGLTYTLEKEAVPIRGGESILFKCFEMASSSEV
jgi:hypothetical protein